MMAPLAGVVFSFFLIALLIVIDLASFLFIVEVHLLPLLKVHQGLLVVSRPCFISELFFVSVVISVLQTMRRYTMVEDVLLGRCECLYLWLFLLSSVWLVSLNHYA